MSHSFSWTLTHPFSKYRHKCFRNFLHMRFHNCVTLVFVNIDTPVFKVSSQVFSKLSTHVSGTWLKCAALPHQSFGLSSWAYTLNRRLPSTPRYARPKLLFCVVTRTEAQTQDLYRPKGSCFHAFPKLSLNSGRLSRILSALLSLNVVYHKKKWYFGSSIRYGRGSWVQAKWILPIYSGNRALK